MSENHQNRDMMETEFNELDATKGWNGLYQTIRNASNQFNYTIKEAKKAENKNLNRYRDVSPYDHTRVKLLQGDKDYINASLLEVPDAGRAYILTQGPLPNTTGHFWQMVWEQNCKAVLMLNKVIEKNAIKCHQYWPLGPKFDGVEVMDLEPVSLRVEFVSEEEASYYTIRHLRLTDLKSGDSRIITHFHYTMWPDFSVPQSPSAFLNFLFAVRKSGALDVNAGPPVVHCSAGIGRSGTFCLVDSCLVLIEQAQDLNAVDVKEMLLDMRKSRMGLIQTADQLRFSYLAILEGAKRVLDSSVTNSNDKVAVKRPGTFVDENEDEDSSAMSRSSDETTSGGSGSSTGGCSGDLSPPVLPAKRGRYSESDSCPLANGDLEEELDANDVASVEVRNNNAVKEPLIQAVEALNSEPQEDEEVLGTSPQLCSMTMKDGAVVTNFSEKLREAEVRKRLRKERNEKMRDKVKEIQTKQREYEKSLKRSKSLWKPVSVSLVVLLSGGYLVYRYFWNN